MTILTIVRMKVPIRNCGKVCTREIINHPPVKKSNPIQQARCKVYGWRASVIKFNRAGPVILIIIIIMIYIGGGRTALLVRIGLDCIATRFSFLYFLHIMLKCHKWRGSFTYHPIPITKNNVPICIEESCSSSVPSSRNTVENCAPTMSSIPQTKLFNYILFWQDWQDWCMMTMIV